MKTIIIDSSGRLVIPKTLREQYGIEPGQRVRLVPAPDGVTIVPERSEHRFVQNGPVLCIDTGAGTAPLSAFDVESLRDEHLEGKVREDRG